MISPDLWPPNSPDLNPVDYKIVAELKERLVEVWSVFGQNIVDEAIYEWRKRLRACVRAKGRQFEHLL